MVSHTASGEWQSFEVRMRRRRADRLVLRAEAAIEAGCLEDARECLTEARALVPALPALDALQRKLSEPVLTAPELAAASEPEPASKSRRVAIAAAILAMCGAAAAGATMIVTRTGTTVEPVAEAPPMPASAGSPVSTGGSTPAEPTPPTPADVFAAETAAAAPLPAAPDVKPDIPQKLLDAAVPPVTSLPIQPIDSMALHKASLETVPAPPAPSVPRTPEPTSIAELRLAAAPVAAPAVPTPPAPEPSHEPAVRAVLERYAAAYSSLDVNAAQRVWPSVNRGALARAFDSLASQQVSLGDCRIDVVGINATARCSGTTSWSPKVGDGGEHNETRSWTFELARGAAGWEIVSARVQNR